MCMYGNTTSKEAVILKLLEEGDTMLCLDARREGVTVPQEHAQNPTLRLILNLNFPHPIDVTADGIHANLAFGGRRFACYIPIDALWAAFNPQTMQGMMWPDSMPEEVRTELETQQYEATTTPLADSPKPLASAAVREVEQITKDKTPSTPRQRGHLRLIK